MLEKYKEEFKQRPGKLIIVFIMIFIVALVCIYQLRGYLTIIWPGENDILEATQTLQSSQRKLQTVLNERYKLNRHRKSFLENSADFWLAERDGDAALNIQKKINKAAETTDVVLSSVGAARTSKISEGVALISVSIRSKAPLKKMVEFIAEIEKIQPRPYWKSLVLRPDNPRLPVNIVLSGNLQFISVTDEEAVKLLLAKKE